MFEPVPQKPLSRVENYLAALALLYAPCVPPQPLSRVEAYLKYMLEKHVIKRRKTLRPSISINLPVEFIDGMALTISPYLEDQWSPVDFCLVGIV